jgi:hypothetical protein
MNRAFLIASSLLFVGVCYAQSTRQPEPQFDLSKIGMVLDGHQICEDKGRLQDYPSSVMDQIIAAGPKSVPVLIGMITDTRMAKTEEPIICFWPGMAIGDIAFCTLEDLFLNADWTRSTIPGSGWNALLGPDDGLPSWGQLHRFIEKHGRRVLQSKWQRLWDQYGHQVFWDPKERCFKLKSQ